MASDWTVLAGTALGAGIGFAQAELIRRRAARDASQLREEQRAADRELLLENREYDALREIVTAMRLLPSMSKAVEPPSEEVVGNIREFVARIAYASLQVRDDELRRRLHLVADAVDLAKYPGKLPPFNFAETVYCVRHMLRESLTARFRHEPMPRASVDWDRVVAAVTEATERYKAELRKAHFAAYSEVDGWRPVEGSSDSA